MSWKLCLQFSGRLVRIKVDNKNACWFAQYGSTLLITRLRENRVCLPRGSQLCMPNAQISVRLLFPTALFVLILFYFILLLLLFFAIIRAQFTKLFAGKISKEQFVTDQWLGYHFAIRGESITHGRLPITIQTALTVSYVRIALLTWALV